MNLGFDKNNKLLLEQYIKNLIKEDKIYKFYKTDEWKQLRQQILFENHNECIMCRQKGVITMANCVHHNKYVRTNPRLALSKYYINDKGEKCINLVALCDNHHNEVHKRFTKESNYNNNINSSKKITNTEKW